MNLRIIDELQAALQFTFNVLLVLISQSIPFIDGNNECATSVDDMTEQMQITIYDLEQDLASRSSQRL